MTKPSEVVDIVKSAQNELSIGMLCAFFGSGLLLTCHVLWIKWDESEMFWKVVYPLMLGGCIYFGLRSFSRLQTALEGICYELKHGIYSHLLKGEEMERFHEWEKDQAWLKTIENKRRDKDTGYVEQG